MTLRELRDLRQDSWILKKSRAAKLAGEGAENSID